MSTRTFVLVFALAFAPSAKSEVLVELVPDNPGPYGGGESLTVDVWLHSQVSSDAHLELVQFDFSDTDPALSLDQTFAFDFSAIPNDIGGYEMHPKLPLPWTVNSLECVCPEIFVPLAAGGSLNIGSIGLQLPTQPGVYRLDTLNADEPDETLGARLFCHIDACFVWRAFTGEITGGTFDFVVTPPIPTVSDWGLIAMSLLLLVLGCLMIIRRTRGAKDTASSR